MTDLITPDDIAQVLRTRLERFSTGLAEEQVGRVVETGDGIARVSGLPGAMANELLDFGTGHDGRTLFGVALNLEEDAIGCVLLGDAGVDRGGRRRQAARAACCRCRVGDA